MRRIHAGQEGQALILGAGIFALVFVFLGIVIYLGGAFTQRRGLQNAADSAALAGAQALNGTSASEGPAKAAAEAWAAKNISGLKGVTATVADGYTTITVVVRKDTDISFSAFGLGSSEIDARAKARVASQNLPGKGVVPIGVELSAYPGNDQVIELKQECGGPGPGASNTGLVHITGDNGDIIRDGLRYGSGVPLQPTLDTETGCKLGQATQNAGSGLRIRIQRALVHNPRCYTWDEVTSWTATAWKCSPQSATEADGTQATAVILIPVIVEDFADFNGKKTIHVAPDGTLYVLSYFWVDADRTWADPTSGNFNLDPLNPKGSIWGRFITEAPTQLTVFDQPNCGASCGIVDFDPDSIFRVVQLVE